MKRIILCLLLILPVLGRAQTYKYIGVEDGLSNRRVYAIAQGAKGYMWFLTHDGIDRYNGKEFELYKLMDGDKEVNSMMNLSWLCVDGEGTVWEIGKRGRIFRYDEKYDRFVLDYKTALPTDISYGFVDEGGTVWLCAEREVYLYDRRTKRVATVANSIGERITNVAQIDSTHFFIGTDAGIHYAEINGERLTVDGERRAADGGQKLIDLHCDQLDSLRMQINELYFHKPSRKVFIGTFQRGLFVYDMATHKASHIPSGLTDIGINRICGFGDREILIATNGAGVYKLNTATYESAPYIVADYNRHNAMNGNTINDIYVDDEQRVWMANYPIGITVRNNRYADYRWIRHAAGNRQSLVNDQVNAVIEDHDGDLWLATNNGVSLLRGQTWRSFLSSFETESRNQNHTFISLCEVRPGIIWVGGYSSGIYQIDKRRMAVEYFTPSSFSGADIHPDKYIRSIVKDSEGKIWSGGYYNLKQIDYQTHTIRHFPDLSGITVIVEQDSAHLWIGTATGLFLLEKATGRHTEVQLPVESSYIYSLCQAPDGMLYIGTNNAGLLVYDTAQKSFHHYHKDNCALISNNIYTILPDGRGNLFLSTEHGLSIYDPAEKSFRNWTREQGLMTDHFNATSGTLRRNGNFVFGSMDGAIEFSKEISLPRDYASRMVFSDLQIFYQTAYPQDEGSPLVQDIDETRTLRLKHNQNFFSLQVSDINFDYPSLILYSWKLEGFYDGWSRPGQENIIRFTNLSPGHYTLHVRAVSNEDRSIILEERSMDIIIEQPFWRSPWAMILYAVIVITLAVIALRIYIMRKERKESEEKIRFFINTAHDIRTPLTLIKAPLEEVSNDEQLTENGESNLQTAVRNVDALLRLTTNLINFERADTSGNLHVAEYELGNYVEETVETFRAYANSKHIELSYKSGIGYLNVPIDKEKMDSVLKNILSNALKYTPEGGKVSIALAMTEETWSVEVKDTGIGVPAAEQKKLFKLHFRGSNAVNSKVTGSGIGLLLVDKLVRLHKGRLSFSSVEGKGSTVKLTFPKRHKAFRKAMQQPQAEADALSYPAPSAGADLTPNATTPSVPSQGAKLLIVEDNEELREYLRHTLSADYEVQTCGDGKQALVIVKEYMPQLIISDIMMPQMRGDDMCRTLKNDLDTSHIPVILLTALDTDQSVIEGLQCGADDYIIKPFNIAILRAKVVNLLANRALLRQKFGSLDLGEEEQTATPNCTNELDWKFIASVRKHVEEQMDNPEFNVDVLCTLLNMSRTSFYNKIKALTDQAPADYVRLIRLKRAAALLKEQKLSVTEISELTGFSDAKYFREVFKKYYGVSPTQYRASPLTPPP